MKFKQEVKKTYSVSTLFILSVTENVMHPLSRMMHPSIGEIDHFLG